MVDFELPIHVADLDRVICSHEYISRFSDPDTIAIGVKLEYPIDMSIRVEKGEVLIMSDDQERPYKRSECLGVYLWMYGLFMRTYESGVPVNEGMFSLHVGFWRCRKTAKLEISTKIHPALL